MEYTLYRLQFSTGLHMGVDAGGPSLDDGRMTVHSDTLFSALCCECAKTGEVNRLYEYFAEDILLISDALPFHEEEYFLPKPILYIQNPQREGNSSLKKRFKSIEYIPLSLFDEYVQSLTGAAIEPERLECEFGSLAVETRVAVKGQPQPMPYNVAYWHFNNNSGLYVIVGFEEEKALSFFEEKLRSLGLSGIGGKQSSGLGKFDVQKAALPPQLATLLNRTDAEYQMLLGTALPEDGELDKALSGGWYAVIRRGGFVRSETYAQTQVKKRTIYALSPGSCLKGRFQGTILDVSEGGSHPVWRCCKTLFAGVNL